MSQFTPPSVPLGPVGPNQYEPDPPADFTASTALSLGWTALKAQYLLILVTLVVVMLISMAAGFVPFLGIIAGIALAPLNAAAYYQCVRACRGERVEIGDIFQVFGPRYLPLLLVCLLLQVIAFACAIPMIVGGFLIALGAAGKTAVAIIVVPVGIVILLAGMGAVFYVTGRLWFAQLLMFDAPAGTLEIVDSLKLSWRRTAPFGLQIVLLLLIVALIAFGSILLLGIGLLLLGIPLGAMAMAAAHCLINPAPEAQAASAPSPGGPPPIPPVQ